MSRMMAMLLLAAPATPAGTQPVTAEQALESYRESFPSPREFDCPKGGDQEEIVVCGRAKGAVDPNRLPLSVAREPGARIKGEALVDSGGCMRLCPQPLRIDLIKAAGAVRKAYETLFESDR